MEPRERRERRLKDRSIERRASTRFPLTLEARYATWGGPAVQAGVGRTVDLSSSGLCFVADRSLATGQRVDVSIDWPVLLDGGVQLQLIVSGVVVRTKGTVTALEIQRHEFRTRSVALKLGMPHKSAG